MKRVIILAVLILLICSSYSFAEVPCKINYQGRLIKDNVPVNGAVSMEFKFYTQETGGTPIKTISINNVPVYNGLFRAVLDLEGVDWTAGETIYLEVTAGGETLSPREPIYAYPYAINTHYLEGQTTAHFLDVSSSTQTKQGGLNIMGNVGIGTDSPGAKLDVNGTLRVSDLRNSAARAYSQDEQNVWDDKWIKVQFSGETYDFGNNFNSSTYIVPSDGLYFITSTVTIAITDGGLISLMIYKNPGALNGTALVESRARPGSAGNQSVTCTDIRYLNAGDNIDVWIRQNSGATQEIVATDEETFIAIHKLSF